MEPSSDRELLIRMDERLRDVHEIVKGTPGQTGLIARVDSLEKDRDEFVGTKRALKGLTYIGGGGGLLGLFSAIYHFFARGH
jgi:hypothetical protein